MHYHAHIYWRSSSEKTLRNILYDIDGCRLGSIHSVPIGPHPLPMFQVLYNDSISSIVESVLMQYSTLPILIHESINDDLRDHTEGARWIACTT